MSKSHETQSRDEAAEYLSFLSGYFYRLIRYEARTLGIRWSALMVLKDLSLLGPSSQRALANIEQMREPTMTVLVKQMEELGWARRKANQDDARVKLVVITAKGKRQLASAGKILRNRLQEELNELSQSEIISVADSLRPLVNAVMKNINEAPAGERGFQ